MCIIQKGVWEKERKNKHSTNKRNICTEMIDKEKPELKNRKMHVFAKLWINQSFKKKLKIKFCKNEQIYIAGTHKMVKSSLAHHAACQKKGLSGLTWLIDFSQSAGDDVDFIQPSSTDFIVQGVEFMHGVYGVGWSIRRVTYTTNPNCLFTTPQMLMSISNQLKAVMVRVCESHHAVKMRTWRYQRSGDVLQNI